MEKSANALGSGLVVWGVGSDTKSPEFTAITARQKIPVLQDGEAILTESLAIVAYISDRFGTDRNRLLPLDPLGRAQCLEWSTFALSELDATSLYVMRRHRKLATSGSGPTASEAAAAYFGQQMRALDRALADGRQCILGDTFSAADIMLSTCLTWAVRYDVPVSAEAQAYNERITRRPAFAAALVRNARPELPHS
jgi:glutathione S-transferase